MSAPLTRRQALIAGAAALAAPALLPRRAFAAPRVLIVGGGAGGGAAALHLHAVAPDWSVGLIERDPTRLRPDSADLSKPKGPSLARLQAAETDILLDEVVGIDWHAARLETLSGRALAYDHLILAPGSAPRPEAIPGLDARTRHAWPAAWGSPREAARLAAQLAALPERGHVILRLPADLAHPQVALERALFLAQTIAPKAGRLTVLDATPTGALLAQFHERAGPMAAQVAWHRAKAGGIVRAVDLDRGRIETDLGGLRADMVNFVLPLGAGPLAEAAGLTDASGWCPVGMTGRSKLQRSAYILGDASDRPGRSQASAMSAARRVAVALKTV